MKSSKRELAILRKQRKKSSGRWKESKVEDESKVGDPTERKKDVRGQNLKAMKKGRVGVCQGSSSGSGIDWHQYIRGNESSG